MPLVTIAEVLQAFPGLENNPDLSAVIGAAEDAARDYTKRRRLDRGPVEEWISGVGDDTLILGEYPVASVSAVEVEGIEWAPDRWRQLRSGMLLAVGGCWPCGTENVRVSYVAGPDPAALAVKRAVILTTMNLFRLAAALDPEGSGSEGPLRKLQIDGYVEEYAADAMLRVLAQDLAQAIPSAARLLLDRHRR